MGQQRQRAGQPGGWAVSYVWAIVHAVVDIVGTLCLAWVAFDLACIVGVAILTGIANRERGA